MPFYEYSCPKCKTRFDLMRSMSQRDDPAACPECGFKKVKRELPHFATTVRGGASCEFSGGPSCGVGGGGGFT
jgi:putative FmdB family regulatory protein